MKIGAEGLALIKAFESFVPWVYDDARGMVCEHDGSHPGPHGCHYREWQGEEVHGTLTIGYGHTDADGEPKITRGMRLSEPEASSLLDADLDVIERDVNRKLVLPMRALPVIQLSQNEFDAVVSFEFNCGGLDNGHGNPSRARFALLQGNRSLFIAEAANWIHPLWAMEGLSKRRAAEAALFKGEDWRKHLP